MLFCFVVVAPACSATLRLLFPCYWLFPSAHSCVCLPRFFLCVFPSLSGRGGGGAGRSALAVRARQALAAVLGVPRCGARSLSPCTALAPAPVRPSSLSWLVPFLFLLGSVLPRAFAACLGLVAAGGLFLLFSGGFRSRVLVSDHRKVLRW